MGVAGIERERENKISKFKCSNKKLTCGNIKITQKKEYQNGRKLKYNRKQNHSKANLFSLFLSARNNNITPFISPPSISYFLNRSLMSLT